VTRAARANSGPAIPPVERVQVLPPPAALVDDVVCCILREIDPDGFEAPGAAAPARHAPAASGRPAASAVAGVVPANVYACLNLVLSGWVRVEAAPGIQLPAAFVTGPFRAPLRTTASIRLRSVSLVLQPWLLADWFGLVPARMVDVVRALPPPANVADAARPGSGDRPPVDDHPRDGIGTAWAQELCDRIAAGASGVAALSTALGELSAARNRPARHTRPRLDRLLLEHGTVRHAACAAGLGERQFERRFAVDHGLAPKRWLRIKRFEQSVVRMAAGPQAGVASLGALAAESGYADQGHMTREFREIADHTPGRLRAALAGQAPGYWAFRPVRVGFVQDPERRDV
jgi:AraC-like DNA-binding protein